MHWAPAVPQVICDWTLHTLLKQQPVGQLLLSHTQEVPLQCWPMTHAGPVPHAQAPLRQALASVTLHEVHVPPLVPQVVAEAILQMPPWQQPAGQEAELQPQLPRAHTWPAPQAIAPAAVPHTQALLALQVSEGPLHTAQVVPPPPHAAAMLPGWHWLFWQQPVGQLVGSHTH
jgi:hypothetical protein